MKLTINKKILFLILLGVLIVPQIASAGICQMLTNTKDFLLGAFAILVVICWIVVAIMFLTAIGSPERFALAKKALMWVLIGTVVGLIAYSIVALVSNILGGTFTAPCDF